MSTDERLQFIELRKREIDLARAMVQKPDDVALWKSWHAVAVEVDDLCAKWDPEERAVLDDLNRLLTIVYPGAFSIEHLMEVASQKVAKASDVP
jgi:hypothetical protein